MEVEIVDANLAGFGTSDTQRAARVLVGPELRAIGLGVLRDGRPSIVSVEGREYRLVPLRNSGSMSPSALMAMRIPARADDAAERTNGGDHTVVATTSATDRPRKADREDPWVEVLRGAIEADLSNREQIDGERQQARAVRGALKFVTYLASAKTPGEVADAAIQAAAVWFDADARVYRRRPSESGTDYTLVASLPGAKVLPEARELSDLRFGFEAPFLRVAPAAGLAGGREGVVVPMTTTGSAEWALVLLGTVPADADVTLEALGRVLGLQVERFALERAAQSRARFEHVLVRADRPVELTALDLMRDLVLQTAGSGAALWVQDGQDVRRLAAIGTGVDAGGSSLEPDQRSTGIEQVRTFSLGPHRRARLELRSAGVDPGFDSDVPVVVDACVAVLRSWLPAATSHAAAGLSADVVADFARRIEEELARAKRFDRDLALVVVESGMLPWPEETTGRLVDVLRGELRGSDVLGLVGERRVVVLLIETNKSAVGTVVRRLRDRLGRAIPELKVPTLVLGQAAFSRDCATADALLSRAVVNAETITLSA